MIKSVGATVKSLGEELRMLRAENERLKKELEILKAENAYLSKRLKRIIDDEYPHLGW